MRYFKLLISAVAATAVGWVLLPTPARAAPLDPNAFASLGTLTPTGNVTINTDTLTLSVAGGATYTGVVQSQGAGNPEIAVFSFGSVDVPASTTFSIAGSRPLALLSQGEMLFSGNLSARGGSGVSRNTSPGIGVAGGWNGGGGAGGGSNGAGGTGLGPGGGAGGSCTYVVCSNRYGPSGGSFGGLGAGPFPGPVYGDLHLILDGGSGGGGGGSGNQSDDIGTGGGAGGGAIELGATGLLHFSGSVDVSGGGGGAPGSGGGIRVNGSEVILADSYQLLAEGSGGGRILVQSTDFSFGQSAPAQISVGTGDHAGVAAVETERISFEAGSSTSFLDGKFSGTALALDATVYDVALGADLTFASSSGSPNSSLGSLAGQGAVSIVDEPITIGTSNGDQIFSGVVSGTGGITKVGAGRQELSGSNTYSGTTLVEAGTLVLSGTSSSTTPSVVLGGTLQGTTASLLGDITNHSEVVFDQNSYGTYSGNISGSGDTTKRGISTLVLSGLIQQTGTLNVESGTVILDGGSIVDGRISTSAGGRFENNASLVNINNFTNAGTYVGSSRSIGTFTNHSTGEVRLGSGESLIAQGLSSHSNSGLIDVVGGQIEFDGVLTNAADTGLIYGRNATMRFDGGLNNHGSLALGFGTTDLYGTIDNQATGKIVVSGLSSASFLGDIANNGSVQTGIGSTSVFYGSVSGAGAFDGTGQILMEGEFHPGNSPAEVHFGGDLLLGVTNTLTLELAGTEPGTAHDKLIVANLLSLGGVLDLQLFGGYQPTDGDRFDVFDAGSIAGMFTQMFLPQLSPGLLWDTSSLQTAGVIQVIPEPATALLVGIGLIGMATRRRV